MDIDEFPQDVSPRLSQSVSQPTPTASRISSIRKSNSFHKPVVQSQESIDEEESGDNFSSHFSTNATSNSPETKTVDETYRNLDIKKLKNSMKLRSAYLNYNDLDDDSDDEEDNDDNVPNTSSNSDGTPSKTAPDIIKQDSVKGFVSDLHSSDGHSDAHSDSHSDAPSEDSQRRHHHHRKDSERENTILTFEIFSHGDNKYCHRTMRNLFGYMLKRSQMHDSIRPSDEENTNSSSDNHTNAGNGSGVQGDEASVDKTTATINSKSSDAPSSSINSGLGFLQLRDLRRLEYLFTPQEEPAIFVRRHAVVISLDPLRVVVMADRLILLVPDGADVLIQLLSNQMAAYMSDTASDMPFEMQAYEAIFGTVIEIQKLHLSDLDARIKKVSSILRKYSIVPVEVQEKVQQFKQRVSEMIERARAHKHILEELLEEDEHLSLLALSLLKQKPHLYSVPLDQEILCKHEDGESLLESYLMDYNSIQSKLTLLKSQLHGAEALVSLRLDTSRNELLITNTVVSVVSCTFAVGGYIGALFGMNLRNGFEDDPSDTFWTVTFVTTLLVVLSTIGTILYLKHAEILPSRFNYLSQNEIKQL